MPKHEPTFYRYRAPVALALLSHDWQPFTALTALRSSPHPLSGIEARQLTGTLVALRNRGLAESRRVHADPAGPPGHCVTEWRLP